ncbi:hypothetical protein ATY78_02395 [Rhizobium sp. R635]|nr:hypothetical protein ATY78_02395 [Rhizobium sp. R635]
MTRHQFGQRDSVTLTPTKLFEPLFGEIDIFEIIEMFENGLTRIKALTTTCALGKLIEPCFDFWRQPQGQHDLLLFAIQI